MDSLTYKYLLDNSSTNNLFWGITSNSVFALVTALTVFIVAEYWKARQKKQELSKARHAHKLYFKDLLLSSVIQLDRQAKNYVEFGLHLKRLINPSLELTVAYPVDTKFILDISHDKATYECLVNTNKVNGKDFIHFTNIQRHLHEIHRNITHSQHGYTKYTTDFAIELKNYDNACNDFINFYESLYSRKVANTLKDEDLVLQESLRESYFYIGDNREHIGEILLHIPRLFELSKEHPENENYLSLRKIYREIQSTSTHLVFMLDRFGDLFENQGKAFIAAKEHISESIHYFYPDLFKN